MSDNYFIKEGYRHKSKAPTADAEGERYWTPYRLDSSKYYQYHVYTFARNLMIKNNLKSCVDVGCGSGYKLMKVIARKGFKTLGIDQQYIINRAKKVYPTGSWSVADFERPDASNLGNFDVVLSVDVIEHLVNPDELLKYLVSLAHKDSYVLISTPERDVLNGVQNMEAPNSDHVREWNRSEFKKYLESRDLIVESIHLLPGLRAHFNLRYLHYLRRHWKNSNYNMLAVCRIRR